MFTFIAASFVAALIILFFIAFRTIGNDSHTARLAQGTLGATAVIVGSYIIALMF